jgi:DNA repair exonuclease SbcCD ATPase subunit
MLDNLTKSLRNRRAAPEQVPATSKPRPTMLQAAREQERAARERVRSLTRRVKEAQEILDDLPPVDPDTAVAEVLEDEVRRTQTRMLLDGYTRDLEQARAELRVAESELANVQDRARNAAAAVAYRQSRVAPIEQHAAKLQDALNALTPLTSEGSLRDMQHHPAIVGIIGQVMGARQALETILNHVLPQLRRELGEALDEQSRIGIEE